MKTSEKDAYISYIKFVAYKIKEDRQLNVDRKVVKKLIRTLIPDRIIDDTNINETTREILLHIVSADKYDDWETDAP
jgi:hypothetical protein